MKLVTMLLAILATTLLSSTKTFGFMDLGSLITDENGDGAVTLNHDIVLTFTSDYMPQEGNSLILGFSSDYSGESASSYNLPEGAAPDYEGGLDGTFNFLYSQIYLGDFQSGLSSNMVTLSFGSGFDTVFEYYSGGTITVHAGTYSGNFFSTVAPNLNLTLTSQSIVLTDISGEVYPVSIQVPEPSDYAVCVGLGILGLVFVRRLKRRPAA